MIPVEPADAYADATHCDVCSREACEDHLPPDAEPAGFPGDELEDAVLVASEGREIATRGVRYLLDGIIPAYGMLGFLVAFAKVGKTTFGQAIAAHVATGRSFLDRATAPSRVLVLAAEDPPEYTAFLARHLQVDEGRLFFRRRALRLTPDDLRRITETVRQHRFGLVLIASWQAVIRGLVKDENDNAGSVQVVEAVKAAARETGVPWLIDAHSGKGEDQADDADPSKAMRGASAAAGAADYTLNLRYGNGTFGTTRRLSGKGRFVDFPPLTLDFNPMTNAYTVVAALKDVATATTWRLICETGALTAQPQSAADIARRLDDVGTNGRVGGQARKRIEAALRGRADVGLIQEVRRGQKTTLYRLLEPDL